MEDKIKEGIIRRMRKEMMRCAQAVEGKKKFCIKLEDEHLGKMITISLALLSFEEEVDCFFIDDDPVLEEYGIHRNAVCV